jgi:hypothetical protein
MRYGRHVSDCGDVQTNGLQSAQSGFAARTGTAHLDFKRAHAVLDRLLGGVFGCDLRRIGRRFARTLETQRTGGRPGHGIPCPSVIVTIVLLNDAFTCATPVTTFFFSFLRARGAAFAII